MSWTKRQFVERAFEEIGFASYIYDLAPEQLTSALLRLDSMMGSWYGKKIRVGYPLTDISTTDLDENTLVPDWAQEAIYTNLAVRIAPIIGKAVSQETRTAARESYKVLLSRTVKPAEMRLPDTMPAGAGNKPWRDDSQYINQEDDRLEPIDPSVEFH